MTSPISEFRDIMHHLFRVVHHDAYNSSDLHILIDKIHDALNRDTSPLEHTPHYIPFDFFRPSVIQEPPTLVIHPDQEVGEVVPNVVVTKEEAEEATVRNVVVNIQPPLVHAVKVGAATDKAIMKTVIQDIDAESSGTPDADTEEEEEAASVVSEVEDDVVSEAASEAEDDMVEDTDEADNADTVEEAVETEEAVEAAEEEEEEEDDDLEILKIRKGRYYFSPSSKRIYEYLEGGYGDCLGTFVDGKIIPKE